ncbi:MAG: FAD-binding oxidoreductase [Hyphomicrobium sp.]|nr:FAD-binding oxidoreductase [Hyphomicrobium sp.]
MNEPSADLVDRLAAIVGPANAIRDPAVQHPYLVEWRDRYHGATPVVLRPGTTDEVARIMALCNEARVGVVPQAGNTGLVGGQIPNARGTEIVLSVTRLDSIRAVDPSGMSLTAEAGVTLARAQSAAQEVGRLLPLSMASEGSCCVGGNLATNAGGIAVLAHGTARRQALGLEVVLADGRIWNGLGNLAKDNTGYDIRDLFIGSEGTLGVITAATLRLVPAPRETATAFAGLDRAADLIPLFRLAEDRLGTGLTAFEFMTDRALEFVLRHGSRVRAPLASTIPVFVLLEVSSGREGHAGPNLQDFLHEANSRGLVRDIVLASSAAQQADLWRLREQMSEVQKHEGGSIKHDIALPVATIPEFLDRAAGIVERIVPGARPVPFGHLGDGNIHYNVSQPADADKAVFLANWARLSSAIHDLVAEMDGSISAEHGIGQMKRQELARLKDPVALDLMRRIKATLDPNGILNPGKVL